MPIPALECKNVWKIYNQGTPAEVQALRGVDLRVDKGEDISIVGASGSGKSTLLHMIGCLDKPTRGKIKIDGKPTHKLDDNGLSRTRREKIGFVFQSFNLIPTMTALENVTLPAIFAGTSKSEREEKAREILKKFGLSRRINHKPNELSGGERQRVAVARALINDPSILLADEPTGNLDSKSGKEILKTLFDLNRKEGVTMIMITHDLKAAMRASRRVYLKDGSVRRRRENN